MTIDSAVYSAVEADSPSTPPKDSVVAIPLAADGSKGKAPAAWVPTLYFAEGLPNYLVTILSLYMFQAMGIANSKITAAIGTIGFVWMFKPLWSPFLEAAPSKKMIVVTCQIAGGLAAGVLALVLNLSSFFAVGIVVLTVIAITSATHDIAADGLYIASLSKQQQAIYAGWQGTAYNIARIGMVGGLVKLVAYWQTESGLGGASAWQFGLLVVAAVMILLGLYHIWTLPKGVSVPHENVREALIDVIVTFFKKPGIFLAIAFIILFRLAEGQIITIGPLFLTASRATGGLGLSLSDQGSIYGVYGALAFVVGSVLGGYFASWLGLKRSLLILILAMNLPNVTYYYLSTALPTDLMTVKLAVVIEMFGYGFGFTALMLYMMQVVAPGKYPTAHYALATGFMAAGVNIARIASGSIQEALGYQHFFIWILLCTIPIVLLAIFLPIRSNAQKQALGLEDAASN
ncbi:MAG TPA: MFS transporter [Burkholderiaceae bacterium]|jgi:PAT family beta-lactamase induction signal transducer AmpG|nr:MFS transporter [Burkholderiaceae bacterium]